MNFKLNAMGGKMYAAGGSFNNPGFNALPIKVQNKIRTNSFQDGGTMNQLTEFNEGGRHEENPLGGIPQGMSPDGRLNLVEEGETKQKLTDEGTGNYIYSDSIKIDKEFAEMYNLPKTYVGKTYADASKLANREKSRRENDTIEQVDIKRKLDSLAEAQEAQKTKAEQKQLAEELAANPELMEQLMSQIAMNNQSVQPMGMPQGEEVAPDQVPQEMLAQMPEAQQGMPIMRYGGNMYRCGGKMYNFGGPLEEYAPGNTIAPGEAGDNFPYGLQSRGLNTRENFEQSWNKPTTLYTPVEINSYQASVPYKENKRFNKPGGVAEIEGYNTLLPTGFSSEYPSPYIGSSVPSTFAPPLPKGYTENSYNEHSLGSSLKEQYPLHYEKFKTTNEYDFGGFLEDNSNTLSGVGTGAMTGATTGAKIGSFLGPKGTVIGGAVGAVAGGIAGGVKGNKKDKELEAEENMQNQALAQQNAMAVNMQDPAYVTPAMQASLQSGMGASYTMPYATSKYGGNLYDFGGMLPFKYGGNMYADGGMMTDPPPSGPLYKGAIASYNPVLPADYDTIYKTDVEGYRNNPKSASGVPMQGGSYKPLTEEERLARIQKLESLPATQISNVDLEDYLTLVNNKPFFIDPNDSNRDKRLHAPYDLRTWSPITPPAAVPETPRQYQYLSANTGQPVYDIDPTTGESMARMMPEGSTQDRQYSQYLEEFANSPEQIAKRKAQETQRMTNQQLLESMTEEQKAEARGLKMSPSKYLEQQPATGFEMEGITFRDGGSLIQSFNPTLMPAQENTRMLRQGDFLSGGPYTYNNLDYLISLATIDKTKKNKKKNKDATIKDGALVNNETEEDLLDEDYTAEDKALDELNLEDLKEKLNSGELSKEEYDAALGEYQSILKRIKPKLDEQDMDFSIKAHPAEVAAMALPAAYNIGMGLFGRPQQFDAEDYTVDSNITPYQYNVNPELTNIQYGFADALDAMRNTGLSGGAYATNVQNLNNLRNQQISELLTKKQNIDAEKYMQAQMANTQLGAQNAATRLGIQDMNARAQAAKQGLLATGLKQVGNIGEAFLNTKLQKGLVKAVAPDFAGTLNLGISPWKNTKETEEKSV
jgi:hypothetical protein